MATPLSYHDASPILQSLGGPAVPHEWQGALPFTYHVGPGSVKVHMRLQQDYAFRTIWVVTGKIKGAELPDEWVVAGNHRDAWVYGAVDPSSGTAAMLETVHGVGALLKQGWKPKRSVIFASWDAEEQGLIGSTEWAEEHEAELAHAVAYFNTDVGVAGKDFSASAVPSLKQFVREVTREVPSPQGRHRVRRMEAGNGAEKQGARHPLRTRQRAGGEGCAGGGPGQRIRLYAIPAARWRAFDGHWIGGAVWGLPLGL